MNLSELSDIDVGDLSTWPIWFRWVMVAIFGAAILYGGYRMFILPEQEVLTKLERNEESLRKQFLDKKELVVNLPAYKDQMIEIQDRFGVVLKQLPDKTEVPALLIDISQVGLARGLVFSQFKPGNPRTDEFYITLPISISVSGTYHQLAEFISDLAALPRIVTLGNMSIAGEASNLSMKAQLFTYQYLEDDIGGESGGEEKVRTQG
ncbi:MAG: type 4a pilus biogenesis protein PilO [Pseudomonadota bacterium]